MGRVKSAAGFASFAGLAVTWYITRFEPRWLRTRRLRFRIPDLPPAFDGYRIVHLSDLHLGVPFTERHLPVVIQRVLKARPDLVLITGDFATGHSNGLDNGGALLAALDAPDGIWAVWGNHDYHVGLRKVEFALRDTAIRFLVNQHHVITRGTNRLVIAGIDDVIYGLPDLCAALNDAPPDSPVILMAHEPDFARITATDPRVLLQLSGHTHGGQIRLPGLRPLYLPQFGQMYPAGWYPIGQRLALYVTHGVGTGQFVMRFNCRPEIVVITLVRDAV
jgi:predicted MPP superfamily phosphohydrolase